MLLTENQVKSLLQGAKKLLKTYDDPYARKWVDRYDRTIKKAKDAELTARRMAKRGLLNK